MAHRQRSQRLRYHRRRHPEPAQSVITDVQSQQRYPLPESDAHCRAAGSGDIDDERIIAIQGLLFAAYEHAFERGSSPVLQPGSVRTHLFDPKDSQRRADYRAQVVNNIENIEARGSEYWLGARSPGGRPISLVKFTPSRGSIGQKLGWRPPNVFINDVVVHPDSQHQGVGRQTLFAAIHLSRYDYEPSRKVAASILRANLRTNRGTNREFSRWLHGLGLWYERELEPLAVGFDQQLEQELWTSTTNGVRQLIGQLSPEVYAPYLSSKTP